MAHFKALQMRKLIIYFRTEEIALCDESIRQFAVLSAHKIFFYYKKELGVANDMAKG